MNREISRQTSLYRDWLLASRPWSFAMTAISIGVGGALASMDGSFSWVLFFFTLVGAVFLHGATNLINDYYDVLRGVDSLEAATAKYRPHPLVEGKLLPREVKKGAYILFLAGAAIGTGLAAARGWPILGLGIIGILASLAYTAPPVSYKYLALGEFTVFLMWGPLMVEGAYFVQIQAFSLDALWISIPFGLIVALVLLANNLRDISHDKSRSIRTVAILLGAEKGFYLYAGLVVLAYASIPLLAGLKILPFWSLIVLFSLPLAVRIFRVMLRRIPDDADARTAQLDTAFGALLLISLIVETLL